MATPDEDRKQQQAKFRETHSAPPDGFVNRIDRSEIVERQNYLGGKLPLFEQHITLESYSPAAIRLMTSGLFGGDAGSGSVCEVELCFEDSEVTAHASCPPGRTKVRLTGHGDAELIQMAETLILAGLNLLKLANHATTANDGDASYLQGSGLDGVMPDGATSGISFTPEKS